MNVTVHLDRRKIAGKVMSDRFGLFVSNEWKRLIDPYTPRDIGTLELNVEKLPWKIWYRVPYAHYVYTGIKYVDPVYKVGAFYSPTYGFWSRPGVKKEPTETPLVYQHKNPYSTDHWDLKAEMAGQKQILYRTINAALQNGQI